VYSFIPRLLLNQGTAVKKHTGDSAMTTQLPEVVQALLNPQIYPDKTPKVDLMQTQMSFIFLTGKHV
jgi:hypothetical protein